MSNITAEAMKSILLWTSFMSNVFGSGNSFSNEWSNEKANEFKSIFSYAIEKKIEKKAQKTLDLDKYTSQRLNNVN